MSGDLYVEVIGSGEPVVFLNGIMMTTSSWAFQTRALSQHFRCVLHDFRGQLRSARPAGPISMMTHVDDLASLLDELGIDSAHLVGTSYGGEVGMLFAGTHPERVRSLSVISSVRRPDPALQESVRNWAETARRDPQSLWEVTLPCNYSPRFIAEQPAFVEAARQRVSALPASWFPALAQLCDAFNALDVPLDAIRCPTLVICGADDVLKPPRYSHEIAAGIPDARLVLIEDAGHAVVIEKPQEVNALLLDFLGAPST